MQGIDVVMIARLSAIATDYACNRYGELTGVGVPDVDAYDSAVRFPLLCYTSSGFLDVGSILLDLIGKVLSAPSRDDVARNAELLARRLSAAPEGQLIAEDTHSKTALGEKS